MSKSKFFTGQPIFSQLIHLIPTTVIFNAVSKHKSDRYYKKFNTYHHLLTMLYACYQGCGSLREVVTGMAASEGRLQPLNMKHLPTRSTVAEANLRRSPNVFEDIYMGILKKYQSFLSDSCPKKDRLKRRSVIIDSTTISLFQEVLKNAGRPSISGQKKGGIKVHMAINAKEDVPYLIRMTAAAAHDAPFMKEVNPPKGSIVIMDRGYNNFRQMNFWKKAGVDWVSRLRSNNVVEVVSSKILQPSEIEEGIVRDERIILGFKKSEERVNCRLIAYCDSATGKSFQFITSNNRLSAVNIAMLYKRRWQIEMLFKRIKQNMPLRSFLGDNENAIKIQIWCALIADLLLKIAQSKVVKKWSFANLASFIRLHLMNYTHLFKFLENPELCRITNPVPDFQLKLYLTG